MVNSVVCGTFEAVAESTEQTTTSRIHFGLFHKDTGNFALFVDSERFDGFIGSHSTKLHAIFTQLVIGKELMVMVFQVFTFPTFNFQN